MKNAFKHGRYKITVRAERAGGHPGFVAYLDWKNGEEEFSAHVRNPDGPLGRFPTREAAIEEAKARGEHVNAKEPFKTVLAEHCDGPFYGGWHIYLRDERDGSRNANGDWGWERNAGQAGCRVHSLVTAMGYTPPGEERYGDTFEKWFAKTFPWGIRVIVGEYRKLIPLPLDEQHESLRTATAGATL